MSFFGAVNGTRYGNEEYYGSPRIYSGAGAGTLSVLLCLAAGAIGYPEGAGAGTLAPLTAAATGTAYDHSGAGAGTLAPLTGEATGSYQYPGGAGAGSLSPLSGAATGTYAIPVYLGTGVGSLSPLTLVGTGSYAIPVYQGAGVGSLSPITMVGVGTLGYPVGVGAGTLAVLTGEGAGTYRYIGAGVGTLPSLSASGAGTYAIPVYLGAGAGVLPSTTASGEGTYISPAGFGSGTLPALTAQATGTLGVPKYPGAGVGSLTPLTSSGAGTYAIPVYTGAGVGTLPTLISQATGTYGYPEGAGSGTLPPLTVVGTGTLSAAKYPGSGAGTLPPVVCSGLGGHSEFFYTDFSEYDDESIPADWSPVLTTHLSHLDDYLYTEICSGIETRLGFIVERGKGTLGDTVLRRCTLAVAGSEPDPVNAATQLGHVVYWDYEWDTPGEIADGEIYARVRAQHGTGILFRGHYIWEFFWGSTGTYFRLSSHNSDTTGTVAGFTYTFPASQGDIIYFDWYNVRIQFVGTAIKMKIWRYGDVEPASWTIEDTDDTWSTGKVGFSCRGNRLLTYGLDCLAVEKSGIPIGSFPPPDDLPNTPAKPTVAVDSIDAYGNVSLECSAFSGDDDASHLNTRWQVDLSTGDFSDPIVDTQYELSALEEIVIPTLPPDSYKVRCLQRDSFEQETSWSDALSFTVTEREDPVTVDIHESPGDIWVVRDLDTIVFRGLKTGGWNSAGPGGSGAATNKSYYDPHLGRYCRRMFVAGSGYQNTVVEDYGVSLRALLSSDTPKVPYTYVLEDMCKVERIWISHSIQANPVRTCFTGVHIDDALNISSGVNGGHEYCALGFRTHNGANWKAYMTTYIYGGGGGVVKEVDTGKAEEDILWWRIELDGWNKQIRWFVDDVLVTSYTPTLGVMDDYRTGGRANGIFCQGEHLFHHKAYPICVAYRTAQEAPVS